MTHRTLCLKMLAALADLGNSPCARLDARESWAIYQRELAELNEAKSSEIDAMVKRIQAKDRALFECLRYLDTAPERLFWPRPKLIARCKQALEK